jgi:hypothetical protein
VPKISPGIRSRLAGWFDNLGSYNARAGKSIYKEVLHVGTCRWLFLSQTAALYCGTTDKVRSP